MRRTSLQLADGRELIYFDERDDAVRDAADTRALPGRPPGTEIRYDPLRDEWVAVAAHRQTRTHLPSSAECPLCPSVPGRPTEIPDPDYDVVVFENRFPSFAMDAPGGSRSPGAEAGQGTLDGLVPRHPGTGRSEVVCFTADHNASFADLPPTRVRTVVEAWGDRTVELAQQPGVDQVFPFENRGEEIGVTLHHPHGQIYAYPFVTPRTSTMLAAARRHRDRTGRNLFADVLAGEQRDAARIVRRSTHWTALVPAAARWPVEVQLYPHRQVPDIPALTGAERDDFAEVYLDVLRRLDRLYGAPLPYVAAWHQAPVRSDRDLAYLHLEVFSIRRAANKLKYLAGSEAAMGVFINDVAPEDVAQRLRDLGQQT